MSEIKDLDEIAERAMSRKESEAGILATLIHYPGFIHESEHLKPEHFFDPQNAKIYAAIRRLIIEKQVTKIDAYILIQELNENSSCDIAVDDIKWLAENSHNICRDTSEEYKVLVGNVLAAAFKRNMRRSLYSALACVTNRETSVDDCVHKIYQAIDDVSNEFTAREEMPQFHEVVDGYYEQIKERWDNGKLGNIPFKFKELNKYATIEPGELIIFGAQQKVGKSIMLLNCAVDLLKKDKSVLYIDSELSSRQFTARLLAHLSGIEYRKIHHGGLSQEEEKLVDEQIEWLKTRKFCHLYMPVFDKESIYRSVKRQNHIQKLDVLIVDYFKSTGSDMDAFQTYASLGGCVDLVKNEIAGAMNIAAIGAAQATATNRLADSAKIARNASTIIMLMDKTPEEIAIDGEECGNKKMVVTVNRNGMQHSQDEYIDLRFDGNHILYEDPPEQHDPEKNTPM